MIVLKQSFCGISLKASCYAIGWFFLVSAILSSVRVAYILNFGLYSVVTVTSNRRHVTTVIGNDTATKTHANVPPGKGETIIEELCTSDECRFSLLVLLILNIFVVLPANVLLLKGTSIGSPVHLVLWLITYLSMGAANVALIVCTLVFMSWEETAGRTMFCGSVLHLPVLAYMWLLVYSRYVELNRTHPAAATPRRAEEARLSVISRDDVPSGQQVAAPRRTPAADDSLPRPPPYDVARVLPRRPPTPPPPYSECEPPAPSAAAKLNTPGT